MNRLITIRLTIDVPREASLYEQTKAAFEALGEAARVSKPTEPALGGVLREPKTRLRVGSYLVEFT